MKNILLILAFLFLSCGNSIEDARRIEVGMTTEKLIEIMGEPRDVEINSYGEEWKFSYDGSEKIGLETMIVVIVDDTVKNFYSL